jgi:hypothetical protein
MKNNFTDPLTVNEPEMIRLFLTGRLLGKIAPGDEIDTLQRLSSHQHTAFEIPNKIFIGFGRRQFSPKPEKMIELARPRFGAVNARTFNFCPVVAFSG